MISLREAFDIEPGEVISLVGGGGKTTLMFALALELSSRGGCVITTTTTKFLRPPSYPDWCILLNEDEEEIIGLLRQNVHRYKHITLATEILSSGKLRGISSDLVDRLAKLDDISHIVVEADGAAQRPLKSPNRTEPVIPSSTSLVIPVVGIEVVGQMLTEENVFRPELVSDLTGLPLGDVVTPEAVALLMTHPLGVTKGSPAEARIIPFINKADLAGALSKARDLARRILAIAHPRMEQVVIGQARLPQPVREVISRVKKLSSPAPTL
jgi:probable selenium-dependent hydroxylase accessory protein YqeC